MTTEEKSDYRVGTIIQMTDEDFDEIESLFVTVREQKVALEGMMVSAVRQERDAWVSFRQMRPDLNGFDVKINWLEKKIYLVRRKRILEGEYVGNFGL